MSEDLSIAATPTIISLSKSQNKDKDVRQIQAFHANNGLLRMQ